MTIVRAPLSLANSTARKSDGACADHQHVLARFGGAAIHRVAADGQSLDEGELVEA